MWLGWGGFSWRSVLSLVPGIWEAPSVRDFPHLQQGVEGRPPARDRPYTFQEPKWADGRAVAAAGMEAWRPVVMLEVLQRQAG